MAGPKTLVKEGKKSVAIFTCSFNHVYLAITFTLEKIPD